MRKIEVIGKAEGGNPLQKWWKYKSPIVVAWNCAIIILSKYCPSLRLKNALLRLTGMKIGRGARIGLCAMFDVFWPEMIEIGENSVIGYGTTVLAHEFLVEELRVGKTVIGKNVLVGANSTILAGVSVEDGSVVSAMTMVNADVPAGCFAEGVPVKVLGKVRKK